jgi:tRNA dimethylallyltransferase
MVSKFEKAIFIIGSTAVGKTKLGIDIAQSINGEIISSDSMQIYQKASLMTAKPTAEEQILIKHHLIDFLPLTTMNFCVRDYQKLALAAVEDITSRGKVPIFVGGTMYYIESILYDREFHEGGQYEAEETEIIQELKEADEKFLNEDINPRHMRNAYTYYKNTGIKPSDRKFDNKLRFENSVVIWLYCDTEILRNRARKRIEGMIKEGGLEEIKEVLENAHTEGYTKGVLQSIGYKEFEEYLNDPLCLENCIEKLLTSTVQYSRKQIRWIKNRMEPFFHVNKINTDNAEDWGNIRQQGIEALNNYVNISQVSIPKIESYNCESCGVVLRGKSEWDQHLKSSRHKRKQEAEISDDDQVRNCEVCDKHIKGNINWNKHIKSRKHLRRVRNNK